MRKCGVLLPVSSIPSKYGIGTFGKKAYEFVDLLRKAGQGYWQILPLGPTGYGDSPYQSFSTFAGNPYLIDLEFLIEEGLLTKKECDACDFGDDAMYVDYEKVYLARFEILRKAFARFDTEQATYLKFQEESAFWLDDYALFMAVKNSFGGKSFIEWDEDIKLRNPKAMKKYTKEYQKDIDFFKFQQYYFKRQWKELKMYANQNGVEIIGDIPIYVALDSSDTWANPELFQLEKDLTPIAVAGCPPDAFSTTGQLWGNPLYEWKHHEKTGYDWWAKRIAYCYEWYDVVRIDHFRGFDQFYSIPFGAENAINGTWEQGPGYDLFRALKEKCGKMKIIAEDLGFLTPSVVKLLKQTRYPGMKILQFAFDSREESDYLPHNYEKNCVVYTGTHDNETMMSWWAHCSRADKAFAKKYLNVKRNKDIHMAFVRACLASVAEMAIIPIQDYLGLGSESRINTPSTLGDNWKWRLLEDQFTEELAEEMYDLATTYCRNPAKK